MDRRSFMRAVSGGLLAMPVAAAGQNVGEVRRIGYLSAPTRESVEHVLQVFLRKLRELGWVEGQNLVIEYRWADGKVERLPGLAAELVRRKVELIIAPAASAALAAKGATNSIPIVMMFPRDPVDLGLVASLARPGGNLTGTTYAPGPEFSGKQLEILREIAPRASQVAVLWNPAERYSTQWKKELEAAARSLRVRLLDVEARSPEEFDGAFAAMARAQADAVLIGGGALFGVHRARLAELAIKTRLPMMTSIREAVEAGALIAYGVNMKDFVGRAAVYVDKILKGARPADLPVEQPTTFELVINLKTAKALGLTIPPSVLTRANEVIQ